MYVDIIVKFGGSAITVKDQFETLREDGLQAACHFVKKCREAGKSLVVVHGAGSFGHFHANKYNVQLGYGPDTEGHKRSMGFCLTRQSVMKLNSRVMKEMLDADLPAAAVSACDSWRTAKGGSVVLKNGAETVTDLLNRGFIPVTHGDCVMDADQGWCILSGDTIIQILCEEMTVGLVVFLTDVDFIYDKPPSYPDARPLPEIAVTDSGDLNVAIETRVAENDVTGGIASKVQSARNIVYASKHTRVFLCNVKADVVSKVCEIVEGGVELINSKGTFIRYIAGNKH